MLMKAIDYWEVLIFFILTIKVEAPIPLCIFLYYLLFVQFYTITFSDWAEVKKAIINYYHGGFIFCFIFYVLKMAWVRANVDAK